MQVHPWPTDQSIAQLVVTDHPQLPRRGEILEGIAAARSEARRAVRTGALSAPAASLFSSLGFEVIDTLSLLRLDLKGRRYRARRRRALRQARRRGVRDGRLRPAQLSRAAVVDQAAFGAEWGNTAASLRRIARATPRHRSRQMSSGDGMIGFAITGLGGNTGYLQRLSVSPQHQRRGVGRCLVLDSLAWMQFHGATTALVNTGVDNHGAMALYTSVGFRPDDEPLRVMELRFDD